MADGYELEALVNLYTLFHDHPLAATGVSVLVEGWDQRLVITGTKVDPQGSTPKPVGN